MQVAVRDTEKGQEYRMYQRDSEYITEWMNREETLKWLFWYQLQGFMEKFVQEALKFPHHWGVAETVGRMHMGDESRMQDYEAFMKTYFNSQGEEDVFAIKFKEILISLNIEMNVKGDQGYEL